jgi:hypothetical protein
MYAFRGGPTNCNAGFNAALIEPDEARGIFKARLPVSHFSNALIVLNVSFASSPQEQAGAFGEIAYPEAHRQSPQRFSGSRVEMCTAARR